MGWQIVYGMVGIGVLIMLGAILSELSRIAGALCFFHSEVRDKRTRFVVEIVDNEE